MLVGALPAQHAGNAPTFVLAPDECAVFGGRPAVEGLPPATVPDLYLRSAMNTSASLSAIISTASWSARMKASFVRASISI